MLPNPSQDTVKAAAPPYRSLGTTDHVRATRPFVGHLEQETRSSRKLAAARDLDIKVAKEVRQKWRGADRSPVSSSTARRTPRSLLRMWPGAESNHRHADFQSVVAGSRGLIINHLHRLPALSPATPRHIHGTPNLSSTHSWHIGARRLHGAVVSPGQPRGKGEAHRSQEPGPERAVRQNVPECRLRTVSKARKTHGAAPHPGGCDPQQQSTTPVWQ